MDSCEIWNDFVAATSTSTTEKENRKVKSRHAAQSRRILENEEFEYLAAVLPVPRAISSHLLDKASTVRLTISYLKLRQFSADGCPSWTEKVPHHFISDRTMSLSHSSEGEEVYAAKFEENQGSRILEAIDGFLFCTSEDGTILYVSETVSIGLGLSQIELIGKNFAEYLQPEDAERFLYILYACTKIDEDSCPNVFGRKIFLARIKCSLVKRLNKESEATTGFKAIEIHLSPRLNRMPGGWTTCIGFSGLASPLPSVSTPEHRLDDWTFVLTLSLDFRIQYIDPKAQEIVFPNFDSETDNMIGISFYQIIHAEDVKLVDSFHRDILRLGSTFSDYFRLLQVDRSQSSDAFVWVYAYGIRISRSRSRQNQNLVTVLFHTISIS